MHFESGKMPKPYLFYPVIVPKTLVEPITVAMAPNWATMPELTAAIGDGWLANQKSKCVLQVPTTLVPDGFNYLLNPAHLDFSRIKTGTPMGFAFDRRIPSPAVAKPGEV